MLAAGLGALFAWWATPFIVSMLNPPDNPVRLALPADWRVLGFGLALALGVTTLFGLGPALRASSVMPARALKGGADPHASRRTMHVLIGAQVAFCVLVTFVAGLFVATFDRLSRQSNGFSTERLLTIRTVAEPAQAPVVWDQVVAQLGAVPGIESVALAGWPLMSGQSWNGFITVGGERRSDRLSFFLGVSPRWADTMGISFVAGRDFRATDLQPGTAIVNETFVKTYFDGEPALGRTFEKADGARSTSYQIVGIVRDARYRAPREPMSPAVYVPLAERTTAGALRTMARATFIVRTSSSTTDPLALAANMRHELTRAGLRVSAIATQRAITESHTIRERLMAMLAFFFAGVALVLAAVGVYGVLDYSVTQRRREIGIRLALGARAGDIARRVTVQAFVVVGLGALVGIGLGLTSARAIETLFYGVRVADPVMLAVPWLTIAAATLAAALRPVLRAVHIDPIAMLRAD
jgi:predicted permease